MFKPRLFVDDDQVKELSETIEPSHQIDFSLDDVQFKALTDSLKSQQEAFRKEDLKGAKIDRAINIIILIVAIATLIATIAPRL